LQKEAHQVTCFFTGVKCVNTQSHSSFSLL
jgi:hypothetical protein